MVPSPVPVELLTRGLSKHGILCAVARGDPWGSGNTPRGTSGYARAIPSLALRTDRTNVCARVRRGKTTEACNEDQRE